MFGNWFNISGYRYRRWRWNLNLFIASRPQNVADVSFLFRNMENIYAERCPVVQTYTFIVQNKEQQTCKKNKITICNYYAIYTKMAQSAQVC